LPVTSDIHPLCSFHFPTPFLGSFSALWGVYLFFASFATKLHFFLGVFLHFITGADILCRCENRRTHQCWPSYSTIGAATKMSVNTVRKHVCALVDKGLVRTEDTTVCTQSGLRRNGNLRYTIQPLEKVLEDQHQADLQEIKEETARWEHTKSASP